MHNAKAGGEIGANGEFYKGGQFVADTEDWVKGSSMTDAERRDKVSVWYECNNFWTVETDYAAIGNCVHPKSYFADWGLENSRLFFGYLLTLYLADKSVRISREEKWNCYAAAFGMDGIWFKNCKYHGKPVSLFVTLDAEGLAAKRKQMEAATADVRWYEDVMADVYAAKSKSSYVGTDGEKISFEGTIEDKFSFEGQYGTVYVTKFRDADGNLLVWMGAGCDATKGQKVKVRGTVKRHEERDGEKQTIVTRCKVEVCA